MKVTIIGGSAGGASVAARLRRMDEKAQITILEKNPTISFATCGIPYYLGGIVKDRDQLFISDVNEFEKILNVKVKNNCTVLGINRSEKSVTVTSKNSIYKETYDKLVIASGGMAKRSAVPGADLPHVFAVRDAADMDAIKNFIEENNCGHAAVIGGGYIGMEIADNLYNLGINISIIDKAPQILGALDSEMSNIVLKHLIQKNISVLLNKKVTSIENKRINLKSGHVMHTDIVVMALGVHPNIELAKTANLAVGSHNGVRVNGGMRTSDENIYALGDVVEVTDRLTKLHTLNPLASIAHKQARVVANNIAGLHDSFKEIQGTSIVKVFDLTAAITGNSEKHLKDKKIEYCKSYLEAPSHATYYPGSFPLHIKLLFSPRSGRILGAQIVGSTGVDKRIDVFATAVHSNQTVYDLTDLELAYTPPFSTTKDPANLSGMVASNMLSAHYNAIHWEQIDSLRKYKAVFIDVRTPEEYEIKTLDGARNIPLEELRNRMHELPTDGPIVLFCNHGKKGYFAYRILEQNGFKRVFNLSGGLNIYLYGTRHTDATHEHKSHVVHQQPEAVAASHTQLHSPEEIFSDEAKTIRPAATTAETTYGQVFEVNACGLSCPGPILRLTKTMLSANSGDIIKITATDNNFISDVKLWCDKKGHKLLDVQNSRAKITAVLQKCTTN